MEFNLIKKFSKKAVWVLGIILLIHEVIIISDGLVDDIPHAQVAVILGAQVNKDGQVSKRLKARLDRGIKLYNDNIVDQIYVSGGLGKEGYYEGTEMANYLIAKGVPRIRIKIDNEGINTRSTALNFVKDFPNQSSVILVSQYFHITRCKLAFRQMGIKNVQGIHCDYFELRDPYSAFREFFGYYKYLLFY